MINNRNKFYKYISFFLMTIILITNFSFANTLAKVVINGQPMQSDVQAVIINKRTLVPFRAIFETLGAQVSWDKSTETITAAKDNTTMMLKIGVKSVKVNDQVYQMDVAPIIINRRTMVPLRFVSEYMGAKVDWDAKTYTAKVTGKDSGDGSIIFDDLKDPANPLPIDNKPAPINNPSNTNFINLQGTFAMQDTNKNQYVINFKPDKTLEMKDIIKGEKTAGTYSLSGNTFVMKSVKITSEFTKEDYKYNNRDIILMKDNKDGTKTFAITPISLDEYNRILAN